MFYPKLLDRKNWVFKLFFKLLNSHVFYIKHWNGQKIALTLDVRLLLIGLGLLAKWVLVEMQSLRRGNLVTLLSFLNF